MKPTYDELVAVLKQIDESGHWNMIKPAGRPALNRYCIPAEVAERVSTLLVEVK